MKRAILVVLLLGSVALPVSARSRRTSFFMPVPPAVVQDTGRWEVWQDNVGRFVMPLPGSKSGGYWPKYSGRNYIFGAGIWIGALDPAVPDTVVAWGYNPNSGQTSLGPCLPNGDTTGAGTDSLARVYDSKNPSDTAQWPERDSLGRAIIYSDQELWAISSAIYQPPMPDRPLGVVTLRRSLAWNSLGPWGDIVKMEFEVRNVTGRWMGNPDTLRNVIVGFCVDADIGYHASERCYIDHTAGNSFPNLAVQYQLSQEPGWSIPPPYFVGIKFVDGPVNNTGDTLRIRSQPGSGYPEYNHDIPPGQPLGMTAFQIFTIDIDPYTPGQRYLELSGRDYRFPLVYNAYQADTFPEGDRRFLLSCGPFNLLNDSTAKFVLHIIGASDSSDLMYKAGLVGVESPPQPVSPNPSGVVLYPSIPNPSFGSCIVRYALPEPSGVALRIYDISGRLVRVLEQGTRSSGPHSVPWDGKNDRGGLVPSGIYFLRLEAGDFQGIRQAVVVR